MMAQWSQLLVALENLEHATSSLEVEPSSPFEIA